MPLIMKKSYRDMRHKVGKKKFVMGRVVIGGAPGWMSTIWEGVKKAAPYVLPAALPFALKWFMGSKKKDEEGAPVLPSQLPSSLADVAKLGLDKAKGVIPPEMLEMYEMMKEMKLKKPKKKAKVEMDDEEMMEPVDGSGLAMGGKRTRRKIKKLIRGNGLFLQS